MDETLEIHDVGRLHVEDGDLLLLSVKERLSAAAIESLYQRFRPMQEYWSGQGKTVWIVVLEEGTELAVIGHVEAVPK